jgi:hypothetical protein
MLRSFDNRLTFLARQQEQPAEPMRIHLGESDPSGAVDGAGEPQRGAFHSPSLAEALVAAERTGASGTWRRVSFRRRAARAAAAGAELAGARSVRAARDLPRRPSTARKTY